MTQLIDIRIRATFVDRLLDQRERDSLANKPEPWYAVVTKEEYRVAEQMTGNSHRLFGYNLILSEDDIPILHTYWMESWL